MENLNKNERRQLLIDMAIMPYSTIKPNEPFFLYYHKLPSKIKKGLSQLKSDDIKDDNWHLR